MPLANYVADRFAWVLRTVPQVIDADGTGPQLIPQDLEDVDREAIGSRRSPHICSEEASVTDITPGIECTICGEVLEASEHVKVMRVSCTAGHLYHYDCLEGLINGIETYANRWLIVSTLISTPCYLLSVFLRNLVCSSHTSNLCARLKLSRIVYRRPKADQLSSIEEPYLHSLSLYSLRIAP
jgi:hypothetical protein